MFSCNISDMTYEEAMRKLDHALEDPKHIVCQIEFSTDHSQSKIIRDFVWRVFDTYQINHPWKGRFVLITDELVNNAIEHGSALWDTDYCVVHAGRHDDGEFYISLEVHDTGKWKDAKDANKMEKIRSEKLQYNENGVYMNLRGRGLFHITEKLVDTLSFSESPHGWLAVKIEKYLPAEEQNKDCQVGQK